MDLTGGNTAARSTTALALSDELDDQDSKKRPASDSSDVASPPAAKKSKSDDTVAPELSKQTIPPSAKPTVQPAGRGYHMIRKKIAQGQANIAGAKKKRTRFDVKSNDKHAPYFGPGIQFEWSDNPEVSKAKAKLNEPSPSLLKIKLKDTKGKIWPSAKFVKHATMDWTDKKMVKDLNKWRGQFITRTLDKNSTTPKASRPRWSSSEMYYMKRLIKKTIRKQRGRLSKVDWMAIAKRMNARFKGTTVKAGEQVPDTLNAKKKVVKGGVLKKDHAVPERSYSTMKNQASRWPSVVIMMAEEIEAAAGSSSEDNTTAESTKVKVSSKSSNTKNAANAGMFISNSSSDFDTEEEESAQQEGVAEEMEVDHDLEGDSDDEMEDQRPGSNPTGGVLIAA